jgi:hypothetical protein
MRVFALFIIMAGTAMAGLIVTANPVGGSNDTYPVGTSFFPGEVAATTNPLGPFSGIPIELEGYGTGGSTMTITGSGSCETMSGAPSEPCLVFSYILTFSAPTAINSISASVDGTYGATFQLLNSSHTVIDSLSENSGNVGSPTTYTMPTPGALGTSFTFDLYDNSCCWGYVSDISVSTTPEPATYFMVTMGLGAIVWTQRRRGLSRRQK